MSRARVVMIGAFPPPVGGAAFVNAAVEAELTVAGVEVTRVNLAGPSLAHNLGVTYHARRLMANAHGLLRARATADRQKTLYIVPDAGLGAWYTRAHMTAAARRYGAVVIHHHSCRYVEEHDRAIAAVARIARGTATHVFLTEGMAEAFQRQYGDVSFRVATNASFVRQEAECQPLSRGAGPLRIGHLSNLCADKGFFAVADAFEAVRAAGIDATLVLAGPILEQAVADRLTNLVASHGNSVRHAGPLAGDDKLKFYREIDVFLFPTEFKQEAAPLVVYEALAAGVPVVATDRGLIAEIVREDVGGAVCERNADFTAFVTNYLRNQTWSEPEHNRRAIAIKEWLRDECARSAAQHEALVAQLAASPAAR